MTYVAASTFAIATATAWLRSTTGEGWTATVEVTVLPADLADGGGPVVARTRTFAIFWGDPGAWAADVRPTQEAVLRGLDGSDHLRIAVQYLRGAAAGTSFGGSFSDPSAPSRSFLPPSPAV